MTGRGDPADRDRWARLRFAIIGPLLAAPPAKGDLQATLRALSSRTWQHPITGLPIRFGLSTIERWYHTARRARLDPVGALKTRVRTDAGQTRTLASETLEALHKQYREHPGWTTKLHYDNLRALLGEAAVPSYGTVRRYMASHGLDKQRRTGGPQTVCSPRSQELRSRARELLLAPRLSLWFTQCADCKGGLAQAVSTVHSRRPLSTDLSYAVVPG